jgi:hypothetical protein
MVTRKTIPTTKTPKPAPTRRVASKTSVAAAPRPPAKPQAKPAAKAKPVVANAAVEAVKVKHKLVRDSFTIPKSEYAALDELKLRANRLARPTKKGELLRAGIVALGAMTDAGFLAALGKIPSLKTGRPKHVKATAEKPAAKPATKPAAKKA